MAIEHKPHLTQQAHSLIQEHFKSLDMTPRHAIDATCGNGFDTLFLAELVNENVYAFDIQDIAIKNTQEILQGKNLDHKVKLIKSGHENLTNYIKKPIDIIMFNLGYLPQADKTITTITNTSITAIEYALSLLSNHGLLSILCYPGHLEGKKETMATNALVENLPEKFKVNKHQSHFQNFKSPILYLVSKI